MMARNKYSRASLRMLFSALLLLFMFVICTDATQNISSFFDVETENREIFQGADAEPEEENKKHKQEKEFDDFSYLTFNCSFTTLTLSLSEVSYSFSWRDLYSAVFTPPPEVYTLVLR